MVLCNIRMGKYHKAAALAKKLLEKCPAKYSKDITRLRSILKRWIKDDESDNNANELSMIEPFSASHRLCKYFPWIRFTSKSGRGPSFIARLSFSFPFVKPPNMIPNVDETILHNEFGPQRDENNLPQPQAIWIKTHEINKGKAPVVHY